jgi:hypothetical protein
MALIDELRRYQQYAQAHKHVPPLKLKPAELDQIIAFVAAFEAMRDALERADTLLMTTAADVRNYHGQVRQYGTWRETCDEVRKGNAAALKLADAARGVEP